VLEITLVTVDLCVIRALSASSISILARRRLHAVSVTLPRVGAHCLRHACARHLLAHGLSLKEIGDHQPRHGPLPGLEFLVGTGEPPENSSLAAYSYIKQREPML
jgi:hypothetical protein